MNFTRQEILEETRELLEPWISDYHVAHKIDEKTNLLAELGIDSVGILQFVLEVEKRFKITINDYELDSELFSKTGNFINIIESKINEVN